MSVGETLRPEDQFTLEIPQIDSERATKDRVFLSLSQSGGYNRPGSVSSVSTITANSGSTKTLRSRSPNEFAQKEKLSKMKTGDFNKNKSSVTNSIAETISCGAFSSDREGHSTTKAEGGFFVCGMDMLPSCCAGAEEPETTQFFVLPDDRSDIALIDRLDEDTLGSVDFREKYGSDSQQATRPRKSKEGKQKQASRKLFGAFRLRRSRTAERERAEKIFLPDKQSPVPLKGSRRRSRLFI